MTSEEIIQAGSGDNAQWLKEIAYQLAVINEACGNYLADKKERSRRFGAVWEAREIEHERIRLLNQERYRQEAAELEARRIKTE